MSHLAALFGPGASGLPPANLLDFAALRLPASPNACLAAPGGHPGRRHLTTQAYAVPPQALLAVLEAVAADQPRTTPLARWDAPHQAQWVQRSARLNFPDIITAEARPGAEGTALLLYSRSLIGWWDLGVNHRRVARWLAALDGRLRDSPPPTDAPAKVPQPPPSALAIHLGGIVAGRHVVVAADGGNDDGTGAAGLALLAVASGAASARLLSDQRPENADWHLRALGDTQGLQAAAEAMLRAGRVGSGGLEPAPHARTDRAHPWWMRESWDAPDLAARLGAVDLLLDPHGLAGVEDPARRLMALARSGARTLLLRSLVLPADAAPGFTADSLWHASALDAATGAALDATLRAAGTPCPQLAAVPGPLTPETAGAAGLAAPLWWFMGEAALRRLLAEAGWTPVRSWRDGAHLLISATPA